jgi:hypothetical protein
MSAAHRRTAVTGLTLSSSLADLAARIRVEHEATAAALTNSIDHAIAAGELLIEAKSQVQHGQWLPWIAEHCEMSDRTVRLYMRLANHKDALAAKSATVADIGIRGGNALLMQLRDDARRDAFHAPVPVRETPNLERRPYVRVAPEDNEEVTPYGARHFLETWRGSTRGDRRSFVTSVWDELRELKSTSSDCSQSGVPQVSTAPEKRASGLPTGSDSPKTPTEQSSVVETQTQPNPLIAAWHASAFAHREEFIEHLGDFIADWHATVSARKKDAPLKYRIWNSCSAIEMDIDGKNDDGSGSSAYESIADQLSELEDDLAEDGLDIPDYLKRAAP